MEAEEKEWFQGSVSLPPFEAHMRYCQWRWRTPELVVRLTEFAEHLSSSCDFKSNSQC